MTATRTRRRGPSKAARLASALGGLTLLVTLLAGVPVALLLLADNPIPQSLPTADQLIGLATSRDLDGSLVRTAVCYLGWLGWSSFAVSVLLETVAAVSGRRTPRIRALRAQRRAAAALIGLVFTGLAGPGTVAAAETAEVVAAPSGVTADAEHGSAPPAASRQAEPYTVRSGDSLWRVAERRLGDGALWPEIAEHNYGVPQPGAAQGLDHTHLIHPGWVLEIPPVGTHPDPDGDAAHVVAPGDTLWDIAEDHLDPPASNAEIAAEWPAWYEANREVIGDDPDLILPGQQLVHPGSGVPGAPHREGDAPEDEPASSTVSPSPTTPADAAADSAATAQARPAPSPDHLAEADSEPGETSLPVLPDVTGTATPAAEGGDESGTVAQGLPARTVAGIGALLAAAVTALIALGRRRQRAKRKRGERLSVPTGPAASTEQELWTIADPAGAQLLDRALRDLAGNVDSLPPVQAVRLTPHAVELYLTMPTLLPRPWQSKAGSTVWALPADLIRDDERADTDVPAPYPCLVTTGHDEEGGHVLVDLEHIGALGVDGPYEHTRQIITALAIELACSPLADDLSVSVIGACREIGDVLGTGRLRYVEQLDDLLDTLEAHAHHDRDALRRLGTTSAAQARRRAGEWAPDVILTADPLTDDQRRRLAGLVHGDPRPAVAAVTAGDEGLTDWLLRCAGEPASESWMLEPVGLDVEPQRITPADYDNIVEILHTAGRGPEPDDRPEEAARPAEPISDGRPAAAGTSTEVPAVPDPTGRRPVVKVLGPVSLEGARGNVDTSHVGRLTEIAAYIALHPGTTSEDLDCAIWPGDPDKTASRAQACSRLRNWLGSDDDGQRYFPQIADGHYRFTPAVHTDWHRFRALTPGDPASLPTEQLEAALDLVTGQPFTAATGRRPKYRWADRLKSEMIVAITDVATVVAQRALDAHQPARARTAATAGLHAEPGMEQLWRLLLQAEHLAGNFEAVRTAVDRLERQLEDLGIDPEPETTELIHRLLHTRRHHLAV